MARLSSLIMMLAAAASAVASVAASAAVEESPFSNPFRGRLQYVNSRFVQQVEQVKKGAYNGDAKGLDRVARMPVAIWIDNTKTIDEIESHLNEARLQSKAGGGQTVSVAFVIYNLPERDCAAHASAGELPGTPEGAQQYKAYIDKIVKIFSNYPDVTIVSILEPDSLPNLVTNLETHKKCQNAEKYYKSGISYAIKQLSSLSSVAIYLDAAHENWLGWPANSEKFATLVSEVLKDAGGPETIRGFATNVANYNSVKTFTNGQPQYPISEGNNAWNETAYVEILSSAMEQAGVSGKKFIVDTSRVRVLPVEDKKLAQWCNVKGAGLGNPFTIEPHPLIDAYLWVKIPGESDGTTDKTSKRFDPSCLSPDSIPDAPEAGKFSAKNFLDLVSRATFDL